MKYLIFFLRWILATVLEHLGDDSIVYLYKSVLLLGFLYGLYKLLCKSKLTSKKSTDFKLH